MLVRTALPGRQNAHEDIAEFQTGMTPLHIGTTLGTGWALSARDLASLLSHTLKVRDVGQLVPKSGVVEL